MIKLIRKLIDKSYTVVEKNRFLGSFKPLLDATDAFFFRPLRSTKESPYFRDYLDLKRLMFAVVIAAAPAAIASIYFYGWRAVAIIIVSYISGGIAEVAFSIIRKEEITEGFLVTGLLFPLILPPTIPLWMVAVGMVVGVVLGKEVFGGTGKNVFNPALVGRVFLTITFPVVMTTQWAVPASGAWGGFTKYAVDAITSASPLTIFKATGELASYKDLFLGMVPGSLGETSKVLIILGGIFLMFTRISDWRIPVSYLGTVALFSWIGFSFWPSLVAPPVFQLLSGGLLFGAMFMATDPVTCPTSSHGRWIYAVGLGVLTVGIRAFSGYVEGVMFAILFMNLFAPALDELIVTLRFGKVKKPYETG